LDPGEWLRPFEPWKKEQPELRPRLVFAKAKDIAHYASLREAWASVPLDRGGERRLSLPVATMPKLTEFLPLKLMINVWIGAPRCDRFRASVKTTE
jgi:hypothetical protein